MFLIVPLADSDDTLPDPPAFVGEADGENIFICFTYLSPRHPFADNAFQWGIQYIYTHKLQHVCNRTAHCISSFIIENGQHDLSISTLDFVCTSYSNIAPLLVCSIFLKAGQAEEGSSKRSQTVWAYSHLLLKLGKFWAFLCLTESTQTKVTVQATNNSSVYVHLLLNSFATGLVGFSHSHFSKHCTCEKKTLEAREKPLASDEAQGSFLACGKRLAVRERKL